MPNVAGMHILYKIEIKNCIFSTIPGEPFINNNDLVVLDLSFNKLVQGPNLEGALATLSFSTWGLIN